MKTRPASGTRNAYKEHHLHQLIRSCGLIERGTALCIGVSGGADSVALVHLLNDLKSQFRLRLALAHVNHGLRGQASKDDERFVRAMARELDLPLHVEKVDVHKRAQQTGQSIEMAARDLRHAFFKKLAREHGYDRCALAHTANDQAETVLLRLLRGAGVTGLGGIRAHAFVDGLSMIRPLLKAARSDLIEWLTSRGIAWREDASNIDTRFLRNRVRHELLPMLEERFNPSVRDTLVRSAELLQADEAFLSTQADVALGRLLSSQEDGISIAAAAAIPLALQRRVFRSWLMVNGMDGADLHAEAIERLVRLLHSGATTATLPGGWRVQREEDRLLLNRGGDEDAPQPFKVRLRVPGETLLPDQGIRVVTEWAPGIHRPGTRNCGRLPASATLSAPKCGRAALWIQSWQPGDRFAPLGMEGSRKIQDIFVDEKVPQPLRHKIPLLMCRNEIIWIPGYTIARDWAVPNESQQALQISIEPLEYG